MTAPLLSAHTGTHTAPRTSPFRRLLQRLRPARRPAGQHPYPLPPSCADLLVADTRASLLTDAEVAALRPRAVLDRPDGRVVIGQDSTIYLAGPPWGPAARPAIPPSTWEPKPGDTRTDLPLARIVPHAEPERHLVFGEASVATVLEAEQMRREYFGTGPQEVLS